MESKNKENPLNYEDALKEAEAILYANKKNHTLLEKMHSLRQKVTTFPKHVLSIDSIKNRIIYVPSRCFLIGAGIITVNMLSDIQTTQLSTLFTALTLFSLSCWSDPDQWYSKNKNLNY